ncbi:uncharacterized protein LOC125256313 isoform X2 [Megalobrama amblycephala]|uniref:uncharacterized protein LOC125256313 isoform X2 n=1 Tax=Megalobrama amblycephala TaxID=75352 RepID=UPI0020142550|nr:uncharacterized protein LOC125256313 isoform X2 [Megalobrama amblycephala]
MELFIFVVFQLLIEVQSYSSLQKPFISVSDDGVQINIACEIPDPVRADFTCSLYTEDDLLHSQRKQSGELLCMFYVTPGELLTRSVSRQLSCDYSLNTEPEIRSPRSDTQTIRGSLQKPFISVSDDGVQINIACEIPDPVRADFTCSFYTEDDLLHSQKRQSGERLCMFYVTPGELLTRSVSRQLSCDYSLNTEPEIRSPRSDTQTIRGSLQKPTISVGDDGVQINIACEIPDPVRADFTCSFYTEDDLLHSQRTQSGELLTRIMNRQLSCDYSLNTEPEIRSLRSDTITIRVTSSTKALTRAIKASTATSTGETLTDKTTSSAPQTTRETQTSVPHSDHIHSEASTATSTGETLKDKTTSVPHSDHIHSEVSWLSVVLVFTGVGLFLSGLMGFICLCHFDSSDDLLTEVNYSSCQVETTSLLTSSVCSKKHG